MGVSVLVRKDETTDLSSKVVAYFDENGQFVLEGYDVDGEHEWEVRVDKVQVDRLLLSLMKQTFKTDVTFSTFCTWLKEMGIPYDLKETTDIEPSGP